MKLFKCVFAYFLLCSFAVQSQNTEVQISGDLEKWNKIVLSFAGTELSEYDAENPFLNYRLDVTFRNEDHVLVVPGYYAADGNASETGAAEGNVWKVVFRPDKIGTWTYEVSFKKGKNLAIAASGADGKSVAFDGMSGSLKVLEIKDKTSEAAKGRLSYTGERYLRYAETKKAFLKVGAGSPENFLGYAGFDETPGTHEYAPHANDWKSGDPTWQNGKGKNIIGALSYLASKGMNSVFFLTMNVQGDGKDVWPWTDENERYRFDCSKLAQWEIVFDHMDEKGLMLHMVLQETENELLLDIGQLGVQRKLYLREMIARFGHHLKVTWNLGEENGPVHWSPKGQDDKDRRAMAGYVAEIDPYANFITLHSHSLPKEQDEILNPLLGYSFLEGSSVQIHDPKLAHETTVKWLDKSAEHGKQWVVSIDEIGPADHGALPDAEDPGHDDIRNHVLWGNLMAGGAGVEWYFGYKHAHMDLNCEDWRSREKLWNQSKIAVDFFNEHLPFEGMKAQDALTSNSEDYVLAKANEIYAIYLPKSTAVQLQLPASGDTYSVLWFDAKNGGVLKKGSKSKVKAVGETAIGAPPTDSGDWVAIVKNTKKTKNDNLLASLPSKFSNLDKVTAFEETDGFLEVEAENFHYTSNQNTVRDWKVIAYDQSNFIVNKEEQKALKSASSKAYIKAFPDTRITHDDALIIGENFFPESGTGGIVSYKVKINTPGKYYIWASTFSTGTEDNGVHVGINGDWPESGARIQWCEGKNQWQWSSAQRQEDNHCGNPNTIFLEFSKAGYYIVSFAMREDGFKLDRWILTNNANFIPKITPEFKNE
ncbi:DUF5060 domain-containing protein [Cellulophaga baltica]|uniref:DUF5060 domain-containing protein n=1 Tax=Cellulophaga baltica TaxID=76594 RepID=UPI0037C8D07C